jgi:phospholipid/cholesterol/gamma-HCH transport system substrate-binding protein
VRENTLGTAWRLAIYSTLCVVAILLIFVTFGQFRFGTAKTYYAVFANVSGLQGGNFVRVAGVEVGKVKSVSVQRDATVRVGFSANDSVILTKGARAVIRYEDLIGGRSMSLEEGTGGVDRLAPGGTIPLAQTQPALDLDALIGGFRPLFRALDPDQVNALSGQLIAAFQDQGPTINSFLSQIASVTNTLADRDQLIGQVIVNLSSVLGSLGDQSAQFGKAVDSLAQLVDGLHARKKDITNAVASANAAAGSIADLLAQTRAPLQKVVHETDRAAAIAVADHDYLDDVLNTLPDVYRTLGRQGLYGDYFAFYICDLIVKLNGKGGQPVYVKLAGQTTGRCAPKK